jgi:hypothetical protein
VIAIDGKTLGRSAGKKDNKAPIHMVSAFAARQHLVLGQVKVTEKPNDIIAIPKLLNRPGDEAALELPDICGEDVADPVGRRSAIAKGPEAA